MSAILKALQKLEADSHSLQTWKINVRTAGKKTGRLKGFLFVGALLSLAILAYAGGIIHIRMPAGDLHSFVSSIRHRYLARTDGDSTHRMLRKDPAPAPQSSPKIEASPRPRVSVRKESAAQPNPIAEGVTDSPRIKPSPKEPEKQPSAEIDKPRPTQKRLNLHTAQYAATQSAPSKPLNLAARRGSIEKDAPSLPMLNDPSLTLQAIAWAEDPQSRIAVINAQILREGESIEGVIIEGIKEDRVIVRKGSEPMALTFPSK